MTEKKKELDNGHEGQSHETSLEFQSTHFEKT